MSDTYEKLIALLDANKASIRLIDHAPEGQTDKVSAMRGHPVEAAAKCIVLIVKIGKKSSRFVPAVVPGNARVCSWTMWVSSCLCFLLRERSLKITLRSPLVYCPCDDTAVASISIRYSGRARPDPTIAVMAGAGCLAHRFCRIATSSGILEALVT